MSVCACVRASVPSLTLTSHPPLSPPPPPSIATQGDLKATELLVKRLEAEDKREESRRVAQVKQAEITRKKLTKKAEAGRRSSMARLDLTGLLQAGSPLNRANSNLDGAFFNGGGSPEDNGGEGDEEERYVQLSKPKKYVTKKAAYMKVGVNDLYGLVTMDGVLEQRINKVAEASVAKKIMSVKPLSCMATTNRTSMITARTAADPTGDEYSPQKDKEWAGKRYCLDEAYFAGERCVRTPGRNKPAAHLTTGRHCRTHTKPLTTIPPRIKPTTQPRGEPGLVA